MLGGTNLLSRINTSTTGRGQNEIQQMYSSFLLFHVSIFYLFLSTLAYLISAMFQTPNLGLYPSVAHRVGTCYSTYI